MARMNVLSIIRAIFTFNPSNTELLRSPWRRAGYASRQSDERQRDRKSNSCREPRGGFRRACSDGPGHIPSGRRQAPRTSGVIRKGNRPYGIMFGNRIADSLQVNLSFGADDNNHEPWVYAMARYLASSRSKTSAVGFPRPASMSARPREIEASRSARRASRS